MIDGHLSHIKTCNSSCIQSEIPALALLDMWHALETFALYYKYLCPLLHLLYICYHWAKFVKPEFPFPYLPNSLNCRPLRMAGLVIFLVIKLHYGGVRPGAVLAIGRGGRETTLWSVQTEFFDQKMMISCLQTNLILWLKRSLLWRHFWTLCEYKLRKMVRKTCWDGALRGITPTLWLISRMAPGDIIHVDLKYTCTS